MESSFLRIRLGKNDKEKSLHTSLFFLLNTNTCTALKMKMCFKEFQLELDPFSPYFLQSCNNLNKHFIHFFNTSIRMCLYTCIKPLQHNYELKKKTTEKKPSEEIVGKGENAGNPHFLFLQQCYLPIPKQILVLE